MNSSQGPCMTPHWNRSRTICTAARHSITPRGSLAQWVAFLTVPHLKDLEFGWWDDPGEG